jgi:hypothetical protein
MGWSCGLLAPTELSIRFPHSVESDGQLASDSQACLLEPAITLSGPPWSMALSLEEDG